MKFINYQIPIGLGVSHPNTYSNNHNNVNGITEESKNNSYKLSKLQLQSGGQMYNTEPCETVFYIFEHPIRKEENVDEDEDENVNEDEDEDENINEDEDENEHEDENEDENEDEDKDEELSVELTEDEALSEEIELSNVDSKEKEKKQSKLIGEITSDKSDMKHNLRELISDIISNSNEEDDEAVEDEPINKKETPVKSSGKSSGKKIRSLKRLFENKSEDDDIYIDNYDDVNSHDTLNSILRALKKSTGGTK
jgi:hypothetical protein